MLITTVWAIKKEFFLIKNSVTINMGYCKRSILNYTYLIWIYSLIIFILLMSHLFLPLPSFLLLVLCVTHYSFHYSLFSLHYSVVRYSPTPNNKKYLNNFYFVLFLHVVEHGCITKNYVIMIIFTVLLKTKRLVLPAPW